MARGLPALCFVLAATAAPATHVAAGPAEDRLVIQRFDRAAELYARNCQGCHGHTGISVDEVPALSGRVGLFLHTAEGRDYIVRVPGVAFALVDDAELALTLNWMLETFSADELPPRWRPFTPEEVGRLRGHPVSNVLAERGAVVGGLVSAGVIPDAGSVAFGAVPNY